MFHRRIWAVVNKVLIQCRTGRGARLFKNPPLCGGCAEKGEGHVRESVWRAAVKSPGAFKFREFLSHYSVGGMAFVVATSLTLIMDAPPMHCFYILWGAVTLIGASHGALGQGVGAGVFSSIFIKSFYRDRLDVSPVDSNAHLLASAFFVFSVLACWLNTVRIREMKRRRGDGLRAEPTRYNGEHRPWR